MKYTIIAETAEKATAEVIVGLLMDQAGVSVRFETSQYRLPEPAPRRRGQGQEEGRSRGYKTVTPCQEIVLQILAEEGKPLQTATVGDRLAARSRYSANSASPSLSILRKYHGLVLSNDKDRFYLTDKGKEHTDKLMDKGTAK